MTDAEYEAAKARFDALAARWVPLLGLTDWHITWDYRRQDANDFRTDNPDEIAKAHVIWTYLSAIVTIWLPGFEDLSDARREFIFVHELMHLVLNEMREDQGQDTIQHEERVATVLAQAFLRTHAAGATV